MTRRYRRNSEPVDDLLPPQEAFRGRDWWYFQDAFERLAMGEAELLPDIDLPQPGRDGELEPGGHVETGNRSSANTFFRFARVWPREPKQPWRKLFNSETPGLWLVYFTAMVDPSRNVREVWIEASLSRGSLEDLTGRYRAVSWCYVLKGTAVEAYALTERLAAASAQWLARAGAAVAENAAYQEIESAPYVSVYDGDEPVVTSDDFMVLVRDDLAGLYWVIPTDSQGNTGDVAGPWDSYSRAANRMREMAENADGRTTGERRLGMDALAVAEARNRGVETPEGVRTESLTRSREGALFGADTPGLIAIVYQPKSKQLMSVELEPSRYGTARANLRFDGVQIGRGYFDTDTIADCARTHTPAGVTEEGGGYGMALYTALGTLAWQVYGRECIASSPSSDQFGSRSPAADRWWRRAVERGIAAPMDECSACAAIEIGTLIDAGLVFWMREPGDYEGQIAEAQVKYAAAFAAAVPDPAFLNLIEDTLGTVIAPETMDIWRFAYRDGAAATPNRRGGRRRERKPAFVTPELEAHVEDLYAGLEGL